MSSKKGKNKKGEKDENPDIVADEKAYKEYLKLKDHPILSADNRYFAAGDEDPDLTLDLWTPIFRLRDQTVHLSKELRDSIIAKHKVILKQRGRMNSFKNKAYGVKSKGLYSMHETILDTYKAQLLEWFGSMHTSREVLALAKDIFKIEISIDAVRKFRRENWDRIHELQEKHKVDYSEVRLVHKKSRLQELTELYLGRKAIYDNTKKSEDYKLLLQTIEQIRKEVEVDKLVVDQQITLGLEKTIDVHLHQELLKNLPILDIIIGRVAAAGKINPVYLLHKLHNSVYAKQAGFASSPEELLEETNYTSKHIYDMDQIKRLYRANKEREQQLKLIQPLSETKQIQAQNAKEHLQQKLQQAKIALQQRVQNGTNDTQT